MLEAFGGQRKVVWLVKILELQVQGFRSLKDVIWKPGDLNVVIGPNGAGKSNLLRLLELASVAAKGGLGKYVQSLGGMEPLVWDGTSPSIRLRVKSSPVEDGRDLSRDSMTYELELARLGTGSAYRVREEMLANYYRVENKLSNQPFKFLQRDSKGPRIFDADGGYLAAQDESVPEDETLLSIATGPFTTNRYVDLYQKQMASWTVYHDLHVNRDAAIRQPAVARVEKRVDADGQNLIPVLHTLYAGDREFKHEVNKAMRAAFGDDFDEIEFPPAADQRIQLRVRWKSLRREQPAADLSDGTLRFLLLLAVLAGPSPAPVIAVDEPETGLHPGMLPIIAEYAIEASRSSQVIMTTHSPQFLDAFRDTTPTTTVATWVDGETRLRVLEGDALGYWLKGYSLGTLFKSGELEGLL